MLVLLMQLVNDGLDIGNTPSTSTATVVKDSFNGGSTAYTLSKVATTNSVSVFVKT